MINQISTRFMKRIFFLITIIILNSCVQENKTVPTPKIQTVEKNDNREEAVKMLKDFYLNFYSADEPLDKNKQMKDFVSDRVLKRIDGLSSDPENLILDYDPFIKGQDYNGEVIKRSLKIEALKNDDEYRVSFLQFGEKDELRTNIDLVVRKNGAGKFLIDAILNDEHLNFK